MDKPRRIHLRRPRIAPRRRVCRAGVAYEPPVPEIVLARRVELGFSGPGSFNTDGAHDFGLGPMFSGIPHTASRAVLTFTREGAGVQSLDDEPRAIDNVHVQVR